MAALAALIAIGTLCSQFLWFPAGIAKAYPVQHAVNVIAAILFGPGPAVLAAFVMALVRNMLGIGSLLAFPGGMIGALFAGILFRLSGRPSFAAIGEIIGTGIVASLVAIPFAKFFMHTSFGVFFFMPSFLISSISGAIIGLFLTVRLRKNVFSTSRLTQFKKR